MIPLKNTQTILIVDDSDDDYEAAVRALSRGGNLANPVHRCETGQQALDYLLHRKPSKDGSGDTPPGIILLDLNMPGIDGRKVLVKLKCDEKLRGIPVIIMSNSDAERDVDDCYQLGANTYLRKASNFPDLCKTIQQLREYWFEAASLPKT
jgi:two-component system, response regulator